ncbi:trypsin-7-like [Belonocnema kinseyi]|uniref:trypsin-7-like n=1 Tax=Belonocnema kinseyi TaxID=2817044 RepID=UPI00143DDFD9|nr:trypsin-7-like [Belonocnema kinseyi]
MRLPVSEQSHQEHPDELLHLKTSPLRIINGERTTIEEFPFLVSLQKNGTFFNHTVEHFCCGNIIDQFWVVTSAQCIKSKSVEDFQIRAGSTSYYKDGEVYKPADIFVHPNFVDARQGFDLALIKLSARVTFSDRVQAIELPEPGKVIDDDIQLNIAGWGSVQQTQSVSDGLRKTQVTKISTKICETTYGKDSIPDEVFCIFRNGYGPCVGDTGSAAAANGTLFGMASWSDSCGYEYPTAYTNIPELTEWIRDVSQVNQRQSSYATKNTANFGLISTMLALQSRQYMFP